MNGDMNREVELRAPVRVQVNYTCAPERHDDMMMDVDRIVGILNTYAEKLGFYVDFGYVMEMPREDVIPGSDLDQVLRETTRPALDPFDQTARKQVIDELEP